jgi:hypothetical protein
MLILLMERIEMVFDALMYIPSFIKIGSGIPKLIGGRHIQTQHRQAQSGGRFHKPIFIFSNAGK